jgi:hypothetical protein
VEASVIILCSMFGLFCLNTFGIFYCLDKLERIEKVVNKLSNICDNR